MYICNQKGYNMKKTLSIVGFSVLYFCIAFAGEFLGFLSPLLWVFSSGITALFTAIPVTILLHKYPFRGISLVFPAVSLIMGLAMGEISKPEVVIAIIAVGTVAEVAHGILTPGSSKGSRITCAVISCVSACYLLPLWTRTDWYYQEAVKEMGNVEYAEGLMKYSNPAELAILIVLCLVIGYVGSVLTEKIFKNKYI